MYCNMNSNNVDEPELSFSLKNVAFRRKALFVEGVSEFVKVAGI